MTHQIMDNLEILRDNLKSLVSSSTLNMKAISLKAGLGETAVRDIIVGRVASPSYDVILKILSVLGKDIVDLKGFKKLVPIIGYIGAGAMIYPNDNHANGVGIEEVEAPPGVDPSTVVALKVQGDSMYPAYNENDIVYYPKDIEYDPSCLKKRCIVQLKDGRRMLKVLSKGSKDGTFTLHSYNAPAIEDVKIDWACKVLWVKMAS